MAASRITVVLPSRGRPDRAWEAIRALDALATLPSTLILLAVDRDDPTKEDYLHRVFPRRALYTVVDAADGGDLVRVTNTVSMAVAKQDPTGIIANLGDDHVCRTKGWDARMAEVLATPGIAYGNDLLQGDALPTAPFISTEIVTALGWYALPSLLHMFIDDAWKALGEALGRLTYVPDVVIEHMHPGAGKAVVDPGYLRADASTEHDRHAYSEWLVRDIAADVARVRSALAVTA